MRNKIMPEPIDSTVEETDVLDEEIAKILDSDEEKGDDSKAETKEEKTFLKKIGTQEFRSEEEYDKFVQTIHGRNAQFAGKLAELGYDPKTLTKKEAQEIVDKAEKTDAKKSFTREDYYAMKATEFMEMFPDAKDYAEDIAFFVGKDSCKVNGKPSYPLAYISALRVAKQPIPEKVVSYAKLELGSISTNNDKPAKKIMKSGNVGTQSQGQPQHTYNEDDLSSIDDIAKSLFS